MLALMLLLVFLGPVDPAEAPEVPWIEGIAGLPSGALVTWYDHQVYVDEAVVLTGPGELVSVATDGEALYVTRSGGRFGARIRGRERWYTVPGVDRGSALAVRGDNVIMDTQGGVVVSKDGGLTFQSRDWETGNTGTTFGFDRAGRVMLFSGQEAGCGGGTQWLHVGTMDALTSVGWPVDSYNFVFGPKYIYATGDCGADHGYALCAIDDHVTTPVKALDSGAEGSLTGAVVGDQTWLLVHGSLYVATGKRLRPIAQGLPTNIIQLAVAGDKVFGLTWDTREVRRLH